MSNIPGSKNEEHNRVAGVPDLPLIIEQLQNQLDDLAATVRALQNQLDHQAARIAALERT